MSDGTAGTDEVLAAFYQLLSASSGRVAAVADFVGERVRVGNFLPLHTAANAVRTAVSSER